MTPELTDRQKRELSYHQKHAATYADKVRISYDVLDNPKRRWWSAFWRMYTILLQRNLPGKKALVVGCGFGDDAVLLAKAGAEVWAFDLSPESLDIARQLADREKLEIHFEQMAAEHLTYCDNMFDVILARDILHHCDLLRCMPELVRVSRKSAFVMIDELYTDSRLDRIRRCSFVQDWLYPRMVRFVYQGEPYITQDERKLNQNDRKQLESILQKPVVEYFNCIGGRLIPLKGGFWVLLHQVDRILLRILRPLAPCLAGRFLMFGVIAHYSRK
jgi:ubiquinone/menaquinone biosynthesis C-methylase UbiE